MSQTQPTPIDYDRLTETEALDILKADFGEAEVQMWFDRNHIISAPDVLYYADAFGDLEDAILLQGWDKTLPDRVHKGLLESGADIFEATECHDIEAETCPSCGSDMFRFELPGGSNYTHTEWVDEWGNVTDDVVEYVDDVAGHIWNADREDDHTPILCGACSMDSHYDFPRRDYDSGSVRIHYGETDEVSGFSVSGNLVRWDFLGYFGDHMTDLFDLPDGEHGLPVALVKRELPEWLEANDWTEIAQQTALDEVSKRSALKRRGFREQYRRIAEEWAESRETHPDLDFTYVIDFATFGSPSFFVAEENRDALLAEIVDLIDRRL